MKSNATMYRLARASAIKAGPRVIELAPGGLKVVAVCSTPSEIRQLYGREGFRIDNDKHLRMVNTWPDSFKGNCRLTKGYAIHNIAGNVGLLLKAEKVARENNIEDILGSTEWKDDQ